MLYLITDMACRLSLMVFVTFPCLLCMCQYSLQLRNKTREEVHAEVGGRVRLPCKHQIKGNVTFMYLQRKAPSRFVNGYHHNRGVNPHEVFANRTAVDRSLAWVELWNVRVNDEGVYESVLMDEDGTKTLTLYLRVTANYSAPVMTVSHSNETVSGRGYVVTCSSSGGYPNASVKWAFQPNVAGTQWVEVNESSVQNQVTMLYAVSRSILVNCSQPLKIRCTVGGAVSQQEEVCSTSRPVVYDGVVIIASVAAAILFIIVIVILVKKKKASPSTDTSDVEAGIEQTGPNTHLMELK
ncbi:CD276 antigen isoform X1 [Anguilla rostrata]|uniref:CD276 antigen isoform X1 n=2 Tax=Anguilla rostrata TaxID=7938 RepID=UPI0030CB9024